MAKWTISTWYEIFLSKKKKANAARRQRRVAVGGSSVMHALGGGSGCALRRRRWGRNGGRARAMTALGDWLRRPNRPAATGSDCPAARGCWSASRRGGRRRRSDDPSLPESRPPRSRAKQASAKIVSGNHWQCQKMSCYVLQPSFF